MQQRQWCDHCPEHGGQRAGRQRGAQRAGAVEDPLGTVEIPAGEPVHIAYWGVLSGADASLGEDSKQGVEIALDDLGDTFKGHDIQLTTEDGLCTPEGGATAATKLAADSTLVGLIGSACSDEVVGGIKSITEAGLTTISPSNTRPALTAEDRDATYAGYARTAHNDAFQGKVAAEYVYNELGLKKAATDPRRLRLRRSARRRLRRGVQGARRQDRRRRGHRQGHHRHEHHAEDDGRRRSPELIYMPLFIAEAGFLQAQIPTTTGLENVKTLGADGHYSADFLKAAGNAAVGHYQTSPNFSAFTGDYAGLPREASGQVRWRSAERVPRPGLRRHEHAVRGARQGRRARTPTAPSSVPKGALRDAIFATKDFRA